MCARVSILQGAIFVILRPEKGYKIDLTHWISIATNCFGSDGTSVIQYQQPTLDGPVRFYREVLP